jgi:hypothetical protein
MSSISLDQILMIWCVLTYLIIYLYHIIQWSVKPVLSTWTFISIAVVLSFLTNFGLHGWSGISNNLFNVIDGMGAILIMSLVMLMKTTDRRFDRTELILLISVIGIWIIRYITSYNVIAHMLIQCILVLAYIPMIKKLRKMHIHNESLAMRGINLVGSCLWMIQPALHQDILPLLYAGRSVLCVWCVFILLLRIEKKSSKKTKLN